MPDTHPDLAAEILRSLRHQRWALTAVCLGLVVLLLLGWWDSGNKRDDLEREAARTNMALCTLRGDLKQRVKSSEDFLATHPKGVLGISAATIRSGIAGQQRTIKALAGLDCTKEAP